MEVNQVLTVTTIELFTLPSNKLFFLHLAIYPPQQKPQTVSGCKVCALFKLSVHWANTDTTEYFVDSHLNSGLIYRI
jgi:hypothetical protein